MLKLFFGPNSCALASHIALEEAGASYDSVRIDLRAGQQRESEYLKVNPKGRVPALVTDRGILTENPAILAFVAQSFPAAGLAPIDDPFEFARVQAFNSYLCSTVHVAHAHRVRGIRWAEQAASLADMQRKAPSVLTDCFALIEREMFAGPWVMGREYSICDPYLFTLVLWMEDDGVDPNCFPVLLDHRKRMAARPAVAKALATERV